MSAVLIGFAGAALVWEGIANQFSTTNGQDIAKTLNVCKAEISLTKSTTMLHTSVQAEAITFFTNTRCLIVWVHENLLSFACVLPCAKTAIWSWHLHIHSTCLAQSANETRPTQQTAHKAARCPKKTASTWLRQNLQMYVGRTCLSLSTPHLSPGKSHCRCRCRCGCCFCHSLV